MPYRTDASAVARERARTLAQLRDLEARFTDVFWRELACDLGIVRSSVRDWCSERIEDDVVALTHRIAAIETVLARWSGIERQWTRPSSRAPLGVGSMRTTYDEETLDTALARDQLGRWIAASRTRIPIDVRVRPKRAGVTWALATSAPRGAGAVSVEPERLLDDLRKMAGVLTDIEVGDERFDGVFLVQGHEATARALLDVDMRRVLLRLGARSAKLALELADGAASVVLHGEPERRSFEDAITILQRLRRAPVRALRRAA